MKKEAIRILRRFTTLISPTLANKVMYRVKMGKKLNLNNPKTFNEKINWLKINVYPNDRRVIQCADKYMVRSYIEEKGLENYLVKLYNSWDKESEIDWDNLPESFVLKCNHGCGYNVICTSKSNFDIKKAKKRIKKWMKEDFGKVSGEPHYSRIKKKIICEEYLEDDILDYKFFCFNGEPKFFYIAQNIEGDFHNMQADFFTADGNLADFSRTDHKHFDKVPKMPKELNKMLELSRKLSKDFPFVRVDLFNVGGKIYFSELTFSPCSGFMPLDPFKSDYEIGTFIDLSVYKK